MRALMSRAWNLALGGACTWLSYVPCPRIFLPREFFSHALAENKRYCRWEQMIRMDVWGRVGEEGGIEKMTALAWILLAYLCRDLPEDFVDELPCMKLHDVTAEVC